MKGKILKNHKYFMDEITYDDLKKSNDPDAPKEHGLDNYERKWLQIAIATGKEDLLKDFETDIKDGVYIDTDGLRKEMAKWKFPLHFIDFETSRSALPFYKGLRPYEQIAFQFSHHKVEMGADGKYKVTHQTQYINAKKGFFPNFEFVRQLKKAVGEDDDTVSNGGAALAAYGKLQFSDTQMSEALEKALLRYCELDTLAMVFIWEYFYDMCNKK